MLTNAKTIFYAVVIYCFLVFSSPTLNAAISVSDMIPIHEAFVPKFTDSTASVFLSNTPPAPIPEKIPPQTYEGEIWIPGYWTWLENKNDFAWICGVWRRPPIDHYWIPGSWNKNNEGWIRIRGFWSNVPLENLQFIMKAPPEAITDNIPPSPGSDYFWAPGYWSYLPSSGNYTWLSGKWELSNPDWILAPANYFWLPSGYVFVPSYWDWSLEERGTAYSCNEANGPLVIIESKVIIQRLFLYYPDYVTFYWHWWHFHPGWAWDECGCVPPWWHWHDWWFLSWADSWGLWWWWGHPGAFPPFWLSLELGLEIAPPPIPIIEVFKSQPKPPFNLKLGDKPLLPKGTPGKKTVPFPIIPNDVTPGGQITLPTRPIKEIKVPKAPPRPNKPPSPIQPNRPNYPSEMVPQSETVPQIEYYPSEDNIPSGRYPPGRPPQRPPSRGGYDPGRWNDGNRGDGNDHGNDHGRGHGKGHGDHGKGHGKGGHHRDEDNSSPTYPRNPQQTGPGNNPNVPNQEGRGDDHNRGRGRGDEKGQHRDRDNDRAPNSRVTTPNMSPNKTFNSNVQQQTNIQQQTGPGNINSNNIPRNRGEGSHKNSKQNSEEKNR